MTPIQRLMAVLTSTPQTVDQLQPQLGTALERTQYPVRDLVRAAIMAGELVCTSSNGVWLPSTAEDVRVNVASLRGRASAINRRASRLETSLLANLDRFPQCEMFGGAP
jgi:hypothetical protein